MKKVGILTVTGDNNYGNKLQNFAMQQILRDMGYKPETIRIDRVNYQRVLLLTYIQWWLRLFLSKKKKKIINRRMCFLRFNKKIKQGKVVINSIESNDTIRKKLMQFDYLVYGSDQIWNPELPQFSDVFLGKYAPKEKNIAVSASMGISTIPDSCINDFKEGFSNFKAISVREKDAKNAIESLDERYQAVVISDPTLIFDRCRWIEIEKVTKKPAHYSMTYFLGKENQNNVFSIIEDLSYKQLDVSPKAPYGPAEFIYLIRHAEAVLTDSYHASIFSIIFGVQLYIFERKDKHSSMNSRINTLIEIIGIPHKKIDNHIYIPGNAIENADVKNKLKNEQDIFIKYLQTNLL